MSQPNFKEVLQGAGFKATPGRLALLELLWVQDKPMPVPMIEEKLKRVLNPVTLYRALEALEAADIVQRVDLQHRHAHYEMSKTHHHHAVCTSCGTVENIHSDELEEMIQKVGKKVSRFTLSAHSLELFGSCNTCVTAA